MSKWIAEFDLEDGDTIPEHMDLNYMGAKIDFHCRPMWIPVSERLPEDHKDVLICLSSDQICIGFYNSHKLPFSNNVIGWGANYAHNWCSKDVLAWMPLPPAWEGEK